MWTCQKCGTLVGDDFEVCFQCGTSRSGAEDPAFVSADDAGPIADPIADHAAGLGGFPDTADELVGGPAAALAVCYQANDLMEAKFIADQLLSEGVFSICDQQELQAGLGPWDGNPRVYCREGDLARARAWLEEYEKQKGSKFTPED
jgi:hypothetical protein